MTYPALGTIFFVLGSLNRACFAFFSSLDDSSAIQTGKIGIPAFPALCPFLSGCNSGLLFRATEPAHEIEPGK